MATDVKLYREGLDRYLQVEPGLDLVGVAEDAAACAALVATHAPRVVLVDLAMPGSQALLAELTLTSSTRVVALTLGPDDEGIIACAELGVAGFVTRDDGLADMAEALRSAAAGVMRCSPRVADALMRRVAASRFVRAPQTDPAQILTAREEEILRLIGRGLSNKEIAAELTIEVTTVKNHVHNILAKLGARRRGEAVAIAQQRALA